MKMSGEEIIPAPREVVWEALNDPSVLKQCIPGCQSITRQSDTRMNAKVQVKLGPMKASFTGTVNLSDIRPTESYRISGQGDGGFAGKAQGGADVHLETVPGGTKLTYHVDAQVGGKLATMGARFIDPVSRKLAGEFFEKFAAVAGAMKPKAVPAAPAEAPPAKPAAPKKAAARKPAKKAAAKKPAKKAAARKPAGKTVKKKL